MMSTIRIRSARVLAALVLLGAATACSNDDHGSDEPAIGMVGLRVGTGAEVLLRENGTLSSVLEVPRGSSTLTARVLAANGTVIASNSPDYRIDMSVTSGPVTVARADAYSFTLTSTGAGTAQVQVSVYHTRERHVDFGPFPVQLTLR